MGRHRALLAGEQLLSTAKETGKSTEREEAGLGDLLPAWRNFSAVNERWLSLTNDSRDTGMNGHVHGNLHQNKERSLYYDIFKLVKVHTEMCEDFNETEPKTFCEVQVASLDASIISGPSYCVARQMCCNNSTVTKR